MTTLDVVFRYGITPNERELRATSNAREVYGIRRISFNDDARTVTVEYDASRLNESAVASLLTNAGLDITGKVALV